MLRCSAVVAERGEARGKTDDDGSREMAPCLCLFASQRSPISDAGWLCIHIDSTRAGVPRYLELHSEQPAFFDTSQHHYHAALVDGCSRAASSTINEEIRRRLMEFWNDAEVALGAAARSLNLEPLGLHFTPDPTTLARHRATYIHRPLPASCLPCHPAIPTSLSLCPAPSRSPWRRLEPSNLALLC